MTIANSSQIRSCTDTAQRPQQEKQDTVSRSDVQCYSTLPYALSKWSEHSETKLAEDAAVRTGKTRARSDSDSSDLRMTSKSSPVEVRRKLSLLEEKRAIFQRRFFDSSSKDSHSKDSVIAISSLTIDDEPPSTADVFFEREEERKKTRARQISVKTFDAFSTFDEETALSYLGSIEENYTESYNNMDNLSKSHAAMVEAVADQVRSIA